MKKKLQGVLACAFAALLLCGMASLASCSDNVTMLDLEEDDYEDEWDGYSY